MTQPSSPSAIDARKPGLRLVLLGSSVERSLSPSIHEAAISALGLSHSYTAINVPTAMALQDFVAEIRRGSLDGANVTMPYKRAVLELADVVAPRAAAVGAANVLYRDAARRVVADNTDAEALARALGELGVAERRSRAVIIGAGGASLAAIEACKQLGYAQIGVTSRSWHSMDALDASTSAERARRHGARPAPWPSVGAAPSLRRAWDELTEGAELVLQATSAGMSGQDSGDEVADVAAFGRVASDAIAYDLVYRPCVTPFVAGARAAGLRSESGLGMLVHQAALSLELWTGRTAPRSVMRRAALVELRGAC
jgi:shikimate dehydrogenase